LVEVEVYGLDGHVEGSINLPSVFNTPLRPDVIRKAVLFQQSHRRQPQGRDPMAGKRTSAISMGTGYHLARLPRVKGSRYPKAQQAAFAPNTRGGRATHPPKAEKKIYKHLNEKERLLAIRSAIAATAMKELVASRGHRIETVQSFPIIVVDAVEELKATEDVKALFERLGLVDDVERILASWKNRSGKAAMRGRATKHGVGPLIVVGEDRGIGKAASNLLGVTVVEAKALSAEHLAPGTHPGRLTVWTPSSLRWLKERYG
jgi:large subunit ribosomal protein L4e